MKHLACSLMLLVMASEHEWRIWQQYIVPGGRCVEFSRVTKGIGAQDVILYRSNVGTDAYTSASPGRDRIYFTVCNDAKEAMRLGPLTIWWEVWRRKQ